MRLPKSAKGKLVFLSFWDHSLNLKGLVYCEVVGWPIEITKKHVKLMQWALPRESKDTREHNQETIVIAQSTIIEYQTDFEAKKVKRFE